MQYKTGLIHAYRRFERTEFARNSRSLLWSLLSKIVAAHSDHGATNLNAGHPGCPSDHAALECFIQPSLDVLAERSAIPTESWKWLKSRDLEGCDLQQVLEFPISS